MSSTALRKNHTSGNRLLAGPTQDVASAGPRESVAVVRDTFGRGEASPLACENLTVPKNNFSCARKGLDYFTADAIAFANKMTGQIAVNTIMPKATSSNE
jgi:hypothetical protein